MYLHQFLGESGKSRFLYTFGGLAAPPESTPESPLFGSGDRGGNQFRLGIRRRQHEIGDSWHDFRTKTRTVEHAVMPDSLLHLMHAAMSGKCGRQRAAGFGLTGTGESLPLAFHPN